MNTSPGGDSIQIIKTAEYLRLLNVSVDIKLADEVIDYSKYDLIHFFNIIRPDDILPHLKSGKSFVVSTIYVNYYEYERKHRTGLTSVLFRMLDANKIEYLKALARSIKERKSLKSSRYLFHGHKSSIKFILNRALAILPNSDSEYKRFSDDFNVEIKYKKVVNAIDPDLFSKFVEPDEKYKNCILCVGRIEGRKNQLNVIRALKDTSIKLVIVGKFSPNHATYYKRCLDEGIQSGNVVFIDHLNHKELAKLYKAAKVHVLASWFETTGLSSLEAGVMDCNLVITRKGDTEEYFKDMAYYCDPDDINSIRESILRAYNDEVNKDLKNYILKTYTWTETAHQTLSAYKEVLKIK
ncbi:glycosyltransferase [Spirosoma pomorum]